MSDRTAAELRARVHRQEVVAELGQQALETDSLDRLMADATTAVAETLDADYAKVLELLPGADELFLRQGIGWQDGIVGSATVPTDRGSQAGYTLLTEEPIIVDDVRCDNRFSGPELLTNHDVVSGISVIIGSVDDPWGILGVHTTEKREFTGIDATFVKSVANVLGPAIETERMTRRLERETTLKNSIVDTSPVGIIVVNTAGEITFVNDRAQEILGRGGEEIRTLSYDDPDWGLVDADGSPIPAEETPFEQVMDCGEPVYDIELGLRRRDDQRIWITVNGAPLSPGVERAGELEAVFAITDVTEERRLEAEFEEILARITDAFYAVDEEFRFTHVNERAEELLQRSESELLGETVWETFPDAAEIDEVWDAFQTARNEQESTSYELYFTPLDIWVEAHLYPSDTGISVYFQDVSERKQRERELEQFHALTNAASDVIVTIDTDSRIETINPAVADVFGYEPSEVVDESLTVLMPDELAVEHQRGIQRYLETGERTLDWDYVELTGTHADGSEIPLGVSFNEIEFEGEQFFTGVVRDITPRKKRERALEASHQRLEEFATAVSHDLKKPLSTVVSYLQLLERRYEDELDEEAEEFIDFAVDSSARMREMIDGFVSEYARVGAERDAFDTVDLDAVLEDVLVDLEPERRESDAEISAEPLPRVEGDPSQLHQLFMNLIDNAIKYSGDEPPEIDVSADRKGDRWGIAVTDEGIGIDADGIEAVFEVFHRHHDPEEYPGTGIGLTLCQRIVERHDGEIWVESEPGEGSTFRFTLPAADGPDE